MTAEIINHLWQSTAFAALAGLINFAFRKNRAHVRYWIWFSASAKFLIPFSLLLSLGSHLGRSLSAKSIPPSAITYTVAEVAVPFPVTPSPTPSPHQNVDWIPSALVCLWVCGALGIALMRASASLRIRAAVRDSKRLQIPFPVPVRTSSHFMEPGVVGIFRPVLLLPAGILEHLAPKQMELMLGHELCHVRRRDNLTAAVHMLVEAVFWFHPLVWWISARLMEERERACDEGVLELGGEPRTYAESILKTCEFCVESPLACVSGVTGADLKKRIVRIMTQVGRAKLNFSRKLLLASFALAAVVGPLVLGLKVAPQVWAQNSQPGGAHRPAFEVASVKPNPGCQNKPSKGGTFTPSPDRMEMPCVNLRSLIQTAYGTFADGVTVDPQPLHMEGGPSWMQSEFYGVSAKAEAPPAHPQMMDGPMLQTLLEERFRLKTHREMRQMPLYAMILGKSGLKLQPLAKGACAPIDFVHPQEPPKPGEPPNLCGVMMIRRVENGNMQIDVRGSTMTQFAQRLSQLADRTVVDQTGIAGQFNFHLEYAPEPGMFGGHEGNAGNATNPGNPLPSAEAGPDLFVALREQIGLKLSSEKGQLVS